MGQRLITPELGTILWTLITFFILAILLHRFAWGPLLATLEEREKTIKDSLDQAQKARTEAEESSRRHQESLAQARREVAALIEQGKRESEVVRGEILAQARKEAQDLVEQGKKQIQYEQKKAMEDLRRQVADLAIQAAERLVSRSLDDRTQRELVDGYVRELSTIGQGEAGR